MKKMLRTLSWMLCFLMLLQCGGMIALPTVAETAEEKETDVFTYFWNDFDSYESGVLSSMEGASFVNGTPTVAEENGRGKVLQFSAVNSPYMEIPSPQLNKMLTFDFKMNADSTGTYGGLCVKPYVDSDNQIYAVFSNGGISVKDSTDNDIAYLEYAFESKWYSAKLMQVGQKLYVKVWGAGEEEPVSWTVSAGTAQTFDNPAAPARIEFAQGDGSAELQYWVDNLRLEKVFADDFEGLTVGNALSGDIYKQAVGTVAVAADTARGNVLALPNTSSNLQIDVQQANKEVTFDVLYEGTPSKNYGVYAKTYCDGANDVYTILGANVYYPSSTKTGIRQSCDNGQGNGFGTVSRTFTYDINTWYSVRLRLDGRNYYSKIWNAAEEEPESWNVTGTLTKAVLTDEGSYVQLGFRKVAYQLDNLVITSVPRLPAVKITATSDDSLMGSVSISGTEQEDGFKANSNVTIVATPEEGYQFDGWYLNDSLVTFSNEYTFAATEYADYVAKFSADPACLWFADGFDEYDVGAIDREAMPLLYVTFSDESRYSIQEENGDRYLQNVVNAAYLFELDCSVVEKQVTFDFLYESAFAKTYGGFYVKLLYSPDTSSEQYCQIMPNYGTKNLGITSKVNGKTYSQPFAEYSMSPMTWYTAKCRMYNENIYIKVWPKNETEPVSWSLYRSIGSPISEDENARFVLSVTNRGNGDVTTRIDNLKIQTWTELSPKKEVRLVLEADDAMGTVTGSGRFLEGNTVKIYATPKQGHAFVNWTDEEGNVVSELMNAEYQLGSEEIQKLTANFRKTNPQVLSFMANGMTEPAVFDHENKHIDVTFASDIDLTKVRPYFYIDDEDGSAKINPYDLVDFSNQQTIELINGWTVTAKQNKVMKSFYVDGVNGSDEYDGSLKKPFKTIERARNAVREITEWNGDVFVNIADGDYFFAETLEFDCRDSAENGCAVIYRPLNGESGNVSFTGGKKLTGWVASDEIDGAWEISMVGMPYVRTLYVDGKMATLARSEEIDGTLTIDSSIPGYQVSGNLADLENWRNVDNIEFVYEVKWTYNIIPVISATSTTIKLKEEPFVIGTNRSGTPLKTPTFIQNCFEYLDEEGEWYYDEAGETIYYIPEDGADPNEQEIVLPLVEQLITVNGESGGNPVKGLGFQNITFEHTDYMRPQEEGVLERQATFMVNYQMQGKMPSHDNYIKMKAAVEMNYASGIRFAGSHFRCLGASALDLSRGVQGATVVGNEFAMVGASGLVVGHVQARDAQPLSNMGYIDGVLYDDLEAEPDRVTKEVFVLNNDVENVGVQFRGSAGIFVGYTQDVTLAHNRLYNLPYTGISIGWGWGYWDQGGRPRGDNKGYHSFDTPSIQARYVVENNNIQKVMQKMADGGAIYTLSNMPGSVIKGNYISQVVGPYGNIYLDEGAGGFVEISENICTSDNYRPYFYHSVDGTFYDEYKNKCADLLETGNNFMDVDSSDDPLYELIKTRAGLVEAPYTVQGTCYAGHVKAVIDGKVVCEVCGEGALELTMENAVQLLRYIDGHSDTGLTELQSDVSNDEKVNVFDAVRFLQLMNNTQIE